MSLTDEKIEEIWNNLDFGSVIEGFAYEQWHAETRKLFALTILKEAGVEELERDAKRYRRLRDLNWRDDKLCCVMNPKNSVKIGTYCPSKEQLDDIIDSLS